MKTAILKAAILTVCSAGVLQNNVSGSDNDLTKKISDFGDMILHKIQLLRASTEFAAMKEFVKNMKNITTPLYTGIRKSYNNPDKPLVVFVHGKNGSKNDMKTMLENAIFKVSDANFIDINSSDMDIKFDYRPIMTMLSTIGRSVLGVFNSAGPKTNEKDEYGTGINVNITIHIAIIFDEVLRKLNLKTPINVTTIKNYIKEMSNVTAFLCTSIARSYVNPNKSTVIIFHGKKSNDNDMNAVLKNAILKVGDVNIIDFIWRDKLQKIDFGFVRKTLIKMGKTILKKICSKCNEDDNECPPYVPDDDDNNKDSSIVCIPDDRDGTLHKVDLKAPVNATVKINYLKNHEIFSYWLYTRNNLCKHQSLIFMDKKSVESSWLDPRKDVVVIVHGWNSNNKDDMNNLIRNAVLKVSDVNVINFDWSPIAAYDYITATKHVPAVGKLLGMFINWLNRLVGVSYDQVHLMGFGSGGHLVGNAGSETRERVKRITALDPMNFLWTYNECRIQRNDAQYVEVFHTSIAGYPEPCGHVDQYPNGGLIMPGCNTYSCSHCRAYQYMAATIEYNHICGNKCSDINEARLNTCRGQCIHMGNTNIFKRGFGIYRANTKAGYPY